MKLDHGKKDYTGLNGSKGLKLENVCIGTTYSFTINPKEQPLYVCSFKKTPHSDLFKWYREFYEQYLKYKDDMELILYLEASPTGRLHFHGTITIKNILRYIQFLNEIAIGNNYEIDTIACDLAHDLDPPEGLMEQCGHQKWAEYCLKQKHIWENHIDHHIIGYPMRIAKDSLYVSQPIPKPQGRIKNK